MRFAIWCTYVLTLSTFYAICLPTHLLLVRPPHRIDFFIPRACPVPYHSTLYHLETTKPPDSGGIMEDILLNIVKEATGSKLSNLKQNAQEAHGRLYFRRMTFRFYNRIVTDLLCSQNNLLRSPSHELRTSCFLPLRLALESKRSKLVSLALTGFNVS